MFFLLTECLYLLTGRPLLKGTFGLYDKEVNIKSVKQIGWLVSWGRNADTGPWGVGTFFWQSRGIFPCDLKRVRVSVRKFWPIYVALQCLIFIDDREKCPTWRATKLFCEYTTKINAIKKKLKHREVQHIKRNEIWGKAKYKNLVSWVRIWRPYLTAHERCHSKLVKTICIQLFGVRPISFEVF